MSNLIKFSKSLKENGGASYNFIAGVLNPNKGYFVALPNREKKIKHLTIQDISDFCNENSDRLFNSNIYLGGWYHEGFYYLDVSAMFIHKNDALSVGRENNQIAIYDAENQCDINIKY